MRPAFLYHLTPIPSYEKFLEWGEGCTDSAYGFASAASFACKIRHAYRVFR